MEVANRIVFKFPFRRLIFLDIQQTADTVALVAAMQGGTGQVRDCGLQGIQAVIQP